MDRSIFRQRGNIVAAALQWHKNEKKTEAGEGPTFSILQRHNISLN